MNKIFINILCLLAGLGIGLVGMWLILNNALHAREPTPYYLNQASPAPKSESGASALTQLAIEAVSYIQVEDYASLASLVHPEYGLVFSPYANINLQSTQCFSAAQVATLGGNAEVYIWGVFDGSAEPISMTPAAYWKRFVWDRDYTNAPVLTVNTIAAVGNALENVLEVFAAAQFVEFHFPGSDPKYENLDWSTLRLVFEEYNGYYLLTAIVHSEWTI